MMRTPMLTLSPKPVLPTKSHTVDLQWPNPSQRKAEMGGPKKELGESMVKSERQAVELAHGLAESVDGSN